MRVVLALIAGVLVLSIGLLLPSARQTISPAPSHEIPHQTLFRFGGAVDYLTAPSSAPVTSIHHTRLLSTLTDDLRHYLLHLKLPITASALQSVKSCIAPLELGQYLPHGTFTVLAHETDQSLLLSCPFVLQVTELQPKHKITPESVRLPVTDSADEVASAEFSVSFELPLESRHLRAIDAHHGPHQFYAVDDMSVIKPSAPSAAASDFASQMQMKLQSCFADSADSLSSSASSSTSLSSTEIQSISVTAVTENRLRVIVPRKAHELFASLIAHFPQVHTINPARGKIQLQNKFAHMVTQAGDGVAAAAVSSALFVNVSGGPPNPLYATPIWWRGLMGQSQVVAVGDTGIDSDLCFFYDANHALPVNSVNMDHRKIVSYRVLGDSGDSSGGHGTHVCGSIAGDAFFGDSVAESSNAQFNGMAPKAKLAFTDIQGKGSDLNLPFDLYHDYFLPAYRDTGARLFSSSWGADEKVYGDTSRDTDRFAYDHPDFLPIFAAGNYGETGYSSIATPANAKNSLAVGAHKNSWQSFASVGLYADSIADPIVVTVAAQDFGVAFNAMTPVNGLSCVLASPPDACSAIQTVNSMCVVIIRGTCSFVQKVQAAVHAGAVLALVADLSGGAPIQMGKNPSDPYAIIPSGTIDLVSYNKLLPLLQSNTLKITAPTSAPTAAMDIGYLSSFSSRGPTIDGRFKPDLLSDGEMIVSANSDGQSAGLTCPITGGTLSMKGTSMATPIAAGSAALVRQYLQAGFHASGYPNASAAITPSASLLRAMLIQSATPVGGTVFTEKGSSSAPVAVEVHSPSVLQGFGRLELQRVLRFGAGASLLPSLRPSLSPSMSQWLNFNSNLLPASGPAALELVDNQPVNTGDVFRRCVRLRHSTNNSFRVTLVWTDPAASNVAAVLLINDLDLQVSHLGSGNVYLGNNLTFADTVSGRVVHNRDAANTVEQVSLPVDLDSSSNALVAVRVSAFHVPMGPQNFSLVMTGDFDLVDTNLCAAAANFCPSQCGASSGRGVCVQGECKCNSGFGGSDCSSQSQSFSFAINPLSVFQSNSTAELPSAAALTATIAPSAWSYFDVSIPNVTGGSIGPAFTNGFGLRIVVTRTGSSGDPDYYVALNSFPTLSDFIASSATCDSCPGQPVTHTIWVPPAQLTSAGRLVIGAFAYCCDAAAVSISVTFSPSSLMPTTAPPSGDNKDKKNAFSLAIPALVVVGCVLLGLAGWFLLKRYQQRAREYAQQIAQQQSASEHVADGFAMDASVGVEMQDSRGYVAPLPSDGDYAPVEVGEHGEFNHPRGTGRDRSLSSGALKYDTLQECDGDGV